MPMHIALLEPEIPPNTGNIARLCAATESVLHLIGKLGFQIDDRHLRRAGLDYWPYMTIHIHPTFVDFEKWRLEKGFDPTRVFPLSARGSRPYTRIAFQDGDCLLFGSESRGLPAEILASQADRVIVIPMSTDKVRSLNLSTAAGIVLYEALRQLRNW